MQADQEEPLKPQIKCALKLMNCLKVELSFIASSTAQIVVACVAQRGMPLRTRVNRFSRISGEKSFFFVHKKGIFTPGFIEFS